MTKSTSKKTQCASCGEFYNAKRPHTCNYSQVKTGESLSTPQKTRSKKLMFGKGGRK